jgi:hypothetical protein
VAEYRLDFPEACRCLLDDATASLKHLSVPPRPQQYVRTSNLAERAFEEERRRTKVIPHLWDEGGLVKLVFAVLLRVSERWGKKCFSEFEQQQLRSLRRKLELDEHQVSISDPKPDFPPGEVPRLRPDLFTGTRGLDRRRGLSRPGHGEAPPAPAAGNRAHGEPRYELDSAGARRHALPAPERPRQNCHPSRGGQRPRDGRPDQRSTRSAQPKRGSPAVAHPARRLMRREAIRDPRAAAGARRTPGRG